MLDKVPVAKRMCPVIFIIDTSESMSLDNASGQNPIGAVNSAIENTLPELISMNQKNSDVKIKIAVLSFDSAVQWITGETNLIDPEDLQTKWQDLDADGLTFMGAAFKELNQKLSVSHGFMQHASGSVTPVLFLLSDGEPNDDYKSGLQVLQKKIIGIKLPSKLRLATVIQMMIFCANLQAILKPFCIQTTLKN